MNISVIYIFISELEEMSTMFTHRLLQTWMKFRYIWILIIIFSSNWLSLAQTITLSPESIAEFAYHNNTAIQLQRYDLDTMELHTKKKMAAFLPHFSIHANRTASSKSYRFHPAGPVIDTSLMNNDTTIEKIIYNYDAIHNTSPKTFIPQQRNSIGISFTQSLMTNGVALNEFRSSSYEQLAQKRTFHRSLEVIRFKALQYFWHYIAAFEEIKMKRDNLNWLDKNLQELEALYEAGQIIENDLFTMKTRKNLAELSLLRSENIIRSLEDEILQFCNLPLESDIVIDSMSYRILDKHIPVPHPDLQELLYNRNDLLALEFQKQSLEYDKKAAIGRYLPNSSLVCMYESNNLDPYYNWDMSTEFTIGLTLDWSIFDWGERLRDIQIAEKKLAKHDLLLIDEKRRIKARIRALIRNIREHIQAQTLAQETVRNVTRVFNHAELKYREGLITSAELLDIRTLLTTAEQELLQVKIQKILAYEEYRTEYGEVSVPEE